MKRLTLFALLLVSCRQAETPAPKPAAPRSKVVLNINQTLSYAPILIAKDEGFFEEEGIDAQLEPLDSNSAVAAAAAGRLDVLSVGVRAGVFNLILKGVPLQVVADRGHSNPEGCDVDAFIAPVDMVKRIEAAGGSPRGEPLATIRGGMAEFLTLRFLAKHGLTMKDVVPMQMPQGTGIGTRDELNAVRFTSEPALSHAVAAGWAGIVATGDSVEPGHQNSMLVFGKRLLHDDPDLGRRFMRAYLRGVRRFNDGKTERNVAILSRYTKLEPEMIRRACWITVSNDGRIDPSHVQPFLDWALEAKYLDAPIAQSQWWNPSFLPAQ